MDHIQLPVDCDPLDITVPYLVTPGLEYDGEGFDTFPIRKGFNTSTSGSLTLALLQQKPAWYGVAFVQAWLYFGLLREVLGPNYREREWIKDNKLCTRKCLALIRAKQEMINQLSDQIIVTHANFANPRENGLSSAWEYGYHGSERSQETSRIRRLILYTLQICDELDEPWEMAGWRETHLAVRVLAARLGTIVLLPPQKPRGEPKTTPSIALIWEHMVEQGAWCIHQVRYLLTEVSYETLYYLANLRRSGRSRSRHRACRLSARCVASNIDDANYKTAHTQTHCDCDQVQAPLGRMHGILRRGGIPVLKCQLRSTGQLVLDYVPAAPGAKYAAISHVWADGLGNPWGQSIPRCQLEKLLFQVIQANRLLGEGRYRSNPTSLDRPYFPVYLWFDVYCVPAPRKDVTGLRGLELQKNLELQRLKSIALARMTASYSWARYVLVLDSELASCHIWKWTLAEVMARIAVSMWNTRCWTYQEFVLGKQIVVFFEHGPQILFDSSSNKEFHSDRSFQLRPAGTEELLEMDIAQLTHQTEDEGSMWGDRRYVRRRTGFITDRTEAFISLCTILNQKNSTKPEDAFDILANLLGLNPAEISALKPRERMKAILRTMTELPLDILLINTPRLYNYRLDGQSPSLLADRWIPLEIHFARMEKDVGLMSITDTGMLIDISDLSKQSAPSAEVFSVTRRHAHQWTVRLSHDSWSIGPKHTRIAIALHSADHHPVDSTTILVILRTLDADDIGSGACFIPLRAIGDITYVSFWCNLTWTKSDGTEDAISAEPMCDDLYLDPWFESAGIFLESGKNKLPLLHF